MGLTFFENDQGQIEIVKDERPRRIITDWFLERNSGYNNDGMWCQQDAATCHTSHAMLDVKHESS